jgi:hypothetical protein
MLQANGIKVGNTLWMNPEKDNGNPTRATDPTTLDDSSLTSLNDMEWMIGTCRPNVLLKAADDVIDAALQRLTDWLAAPLHVCDLPGPATLPLQNGGALLIRDVAALDAEQQALMMEWLDVNEGSVQVISATATDLFAAVERGTFSERLYYRLNTILAEVGLGGEEEAIAI